MLEGRGREVETGRSKYVRKGRDGGKRKVKTVNGRRVDWRAGGREWVKAKIYCGSSSFFFLSLVRVETREDHS